MVKASHGDLQGKWAGYISFLVWTVNNCHVTAVSGQLVPGIFKTCTVCLRLVVTVMLGRVLAWALRCGDTWTHKGVSHFNLYARWRWMYSSFRSSYPHKNPPTPTLLLFASSGGLVKKSMKMYQGCDALSCGSNVPTFLKNLFPPPSSTSTVELRIILKYIFKNRVGGRWLYYLAHSVDKWWAFVTTVMNHRVS
jgi:hypothetical protein